VSLAEDIEVCSGNAGRLAAYVGISFWAIALALGYSAPAYAVTQAELDMRRAQWNAHGISDYDYTLAQQCFCGPIVGPAVVSVRSEVITLVKDPATMVVAPPPYQDDYQTISELFTFLQQGLNFPAHTLTATFDPQLGYPSQIDFDFSLAIADDEGSFTASQLVAVPEPGTRIPILAALAAWLARRRVTSF
jgi:hypothetical protein